MFIFNEMDVKSLYIELNKNHYLSEDDVQELAIKLWQKRHTYDSNKAKLSTWIQTCAKNYIIGKRRSKAYKQQQLTDGVKDYFIPNGNDGGYFTIDSKMTSFNKSPLEILIIKERLSLVLDFINRLTPKERQALSNSLNGFDYSYANLSRARLKLKVKFKER